MRLLLRHRSPLSTAYRRWITAPPTSGSSGPAGAIVDLYEVRVPIGPGRSAESVFKGIRTRFLAYDIFPPWLIQHAIYPEDRIGGCSLVVQRVVLGPLALEMAVRVFGVWSWRRGGVQEAGFSYVTLKGHPECGAETFRVSIDADEYVTVRIEARSRPGLLLTRLGLPAARLFQRAITRAAIRRLTRT